MRVPSSGPRFVLGSDVGGTFTDTVLVDRETGRVWSSKVPSRDRRQEEAVRDGVKETLARFAADVDAGVVDGLAQADLASVGPLSLHHGSTVATNALLERRGAKTALVTNAGFEDLLEIRRQDRPGLYDLDVVRPDPLVPRTLRFGLQCRRGPKGEAWGVGGQQLDQSVHELTARLRDAAVEAVAVGFLHADLHPADEARVAALLREALPGVAVVASHEVWPEMREVERFETTVLNAYLVPLLGPYVTRLETAVEGAARRIGGIDKVRIIDSAGTLLSTTEAARRPAALLLSGPAGGVAATAALADEMALGPVVSFDVGGTSTDVALVLGAAARLTSEGRVGGFACRFPAVEMHTLGAGGGSVLWRDAGGHLQVGPQSQGAYPGPACYGRGGEIPTLTDALVLAGRVPPGLVFGGRTRPDRQAAFRAMERLAQSLRTPLEETVLGAIRLAVEATAGGVQVVTTHRGHDPRQARLVAFGGAGPMLGAELAEAMGMHEVVVPWDAGAFSARGMVGAPLVVRRAAGLDLTLDGPDGVAPLAHAWDALVRKSEQDSAKDAAVIGRVALRYEGQSHELEVEVARDDDRAAIVKRFEAVHEEAFGHVHAGRPVQAVRLVVERVVRSADPGFRVQPGAGSQTDKPEGLAEEQVVWVKAEGGGVEERLARVVWRSDLAPGARLPGPAVVPDATATTYVPPGWTVEVDSTTCSLRLLREGL